jgi:hypothetical protein
VSAYVLAMFVLMVRKPLIPVRGMRGSLRAFHHLRPTYLSRRLGFRRLNCPNPWRRFADTTLHTHDQQIPGNKGLTATPTAAVVLTLFAQVALIQLVIVTKR